MKIKLGVLFGGTSVEHEVSIISAVQAMESMDDTKYDIIPIYISKNRTWYTGAMLRDIDVYKVAHHGYVSFNNHQDALNYLKSDYAVITNTRKPSNVALSRVRKAVGRAVPAYYSAEGTVVMTIDTGGNIKFIK